MTISMLHPLAAVRLRPRAPIIGVDMSTVRASACVLEHSEAGAPRPRWSSKTMPAHDHLGLRVSLAQEALAGWLEELEADHGLPAAFGVELPMAGPKTPLVSFFYIGALLAAVGDTWSAAVPVMTMGPGAWKKPATGSGYAPGLPRSASSDKRRKAEKARLMSWAVDVMGYTGAMQDEADACGVAVATALKVKR